MLLERFNAPASHGACKNKCVKLTYICSRDLNAASHIIHGRGETDHLGVCGSKVPNILIQLMLRKRMVYLFLLTEKVCYGRMSGIVVAPCPLWGHYSIPPGSWAVADPKKACHISVHAAGVRGQKL